MPAKKPKRVKVTPATRAFTTDLRYGIGRLRWGDDLTIVGEALREGLLFMAAGPTTLDVFEGLGEGLLGDARGVKVTFLAHDDSTLAGLRVRDDSARLARFLAVFGVAQPAQAATWAVGEVTCSLSGDDLSELTLTVPRQPAAGEAPNALGDGAPPARLDFVVYHREPLTGAGLQLEKKLRRLVSQLDRREVTVAAWLQALDGAADLATASRAVHSAGVIEALGDALATEALLALLAAGVPAAPPRQWCNARPMTSAIAASRRRTDLPALLACLDAVIAAGASLDEVDSGEVAALELEFYWGTRTPGLFDALWARASLAARLHAVGSALLPRGGRLGRHLTELEPLVARLPGVALDALSVRGLSAWHLAAAHGDVAVLSRLAPLINDRHHRTGRDAQVYVINLIPFAAWVPVAELDALGLIDQLLATPAQQEHLVAAHAIAARDAEVARLEANRIWLRGAFG